MSGEALHPRVQVKLSAARLSGEVLEKGEERFAVASAPYSFVTRS